MFKKSPKPHENKVICKCTNSTSPYIDVIQSNLGAIRGVEEDLVAPFPDSLCRCVHIIVIAY